jgi:GNAT superfamily N-acetyltransferase
MPDETSASGDRMSEPAITVTATPTPAELEAIGGGLAAFNESDVGPANRTPLAVVVRNEAGSIVAGISGYTAWGWLYLQWLWVAETQRGEGLAGRMLALAEDEGRSRGCHAAYIDTFNPVALKIYDRAGYVAFGQLDDFPKGRTRTFLQKRL